MFDTLRFIIAIPLLFVLPGLCLTQTFLLSANPIEKSTSAVLLSMFATYTSLLITEKIMDKLTPLNTAITVVLVNLICLGIFLFTLLRRRTRSN